MKTRPLANHLYSAASVEDLASLCAHIAHVIKDEWQIPLTGPEVEHSLCEWAALHSTRAGEIVRLTLPGRAPVTPMWSVRVLGNDTFRRDMRVSADSADEAGRAAISACEGLTIEQLTASDIVKAPGY